MISSYASRGTRASASWHPRCLRSPCRRCPARSAASTPGAPRWGPSCTGVEAEAGFWMKRSGTSPWKMLEISMHFTSCNHEKRGFHHEEWWKTWHFMVMNRDWTMKHMIYHWLVYQMIYNLIYQLVNLPLIYPWFTLDLPFSPIGIKLKIWSSRLRI